MAINPLYIPLFNIEEVILDKDSGLPLAAGVVKFYRDSQRLTPKPVYQIAGTSPNYTFISLGAELTLGLSGTFVDSDGDPMVPYAFPYDDEGELDLYYVTVESEGGVDQFVRQAVPYVDTSGISPSERTNTENEMSNPQFVEVNFLENEVATISVTGTNTVTAIAPGWDVITTGTGTLTLERLQPTSANTVTNPPFALRIQGSSGLGSTIQLRQRFLNTPSIFRNGFASASITAAVLSGGGSFISMNYIPSSGTPTEIIPSTAIPTDGAYHVIANNAAIPDQGNPAADTGYIDISITLPTSRNIAITSIQVVGVAFSENIPFDEQTAARQRDHLAHYYKPQLAYKPIPSMLVGWEFQVNPAQFGETISPIATGANKSFYAWDQTIVFQSADSGIGITRGGNGQLVLTAAATTQVAIIQYLPASAVRQNLINRMAVNLAAIAQNADVNATISLWYTTDGSLPSTVGSNNSIVATLDANGKPATFNGNWVEIPRLIGQDATFTITDLDPVDSSYPNYNFDGWFLGNGSPAVNATFIAIVVGTATIDTPNLVGIASCSLCSGDIATIPAPQTNEEALSACQYYYESSYNNGVVAGTSTTAGLRFAEQLASGSSPINLIGRSFGFSFNTLKRTNPVVTLLGATGSSANVSGSISNAGASAGFANIAIANWTQNWLNTKSVAYVSNTIASLQTLAQVSSTPEAFIAFHYTADARLGL